MKTLTTSETIFLVIDSSSVILRELATPKPKWKLIEMEADYILARAKEQIVKANQSPITSKQKP